MNTVPFTLSNDSLVVFIDGVPNAVDKSHPSWSEILDILRSGDVDEAKLNSLLSYKASLENKVKGTSAAGKVTVGQDAVYFNGQVINSYLTQTMLKLFSQGFDVTPWTKFMEKLYQNPSKTAVDELFLWLDKAQMPITKEGNFLAYKKVDDNYASFHRAPGGKVVYNRPGDVVEMPRNAVDDDRNRTCSAGLHFCSYHYLPSYYGNTGKVVIVEINPADVVSIPSDYDNSKGRAWRYVVIGEVDESKTSFAFNNYTVSDYDEDDNFSWYNEDDDYNY